MKTVEITTLSKAEAIGQIKLMTDVAELGSVGKMKSVLDVIEYFETRAAECYKILGIKEKI